MAEATEKKTAAPWLSADGGDLDRYIPENVRTLDDLQTEIPRLAKDPQAVQARMSGTPLKPAALRDL